MQSLWEVAHRAVGFLSRHQVLSAVVLGAIILTLPHFVLAQSEFWTKFNANPLNSIAILLSQILDIVTAALGKLILTIIEMLVVPILGYNGFSTSNVIGLGWSLVRDVVNMFVVAVLIVLAVMTIVGSPKANWQQQLPRIFIAVIMVNFSRTICGLLIDVSQVIMFTFVNALVDIAGGNFANMLQLTNVGSFSNAFVEKANANGTGLGGIDFLISAYVRLALYLAICAVMILLAIAFIYRIVVLWVLVIMSPMAFFLGGIKEMFGKAGGAYSQWWEQFGAALTMGPMLAFFLWLALAASSGGSLDKTEGFTSAGESSNYVLAGLGSDNLLGLLLALVLLVVGMREAGKSASTLGGLAATMINEGMGKKIVTGALTRPAVYTGRAMKVGAQSADRYAGRTMDLMARKVYGADAKQFGSLTSAVGSSVTDAGKTVGTSGVFGGAQLGRAIARAGGAVQTVGDAGLEEAKKKAMERQKKQTKEEQIANTQIDMASGKAVTSSGQDDQDQRMLRIATDKAYQKQLKKSLGGQEYGKLMTQAMQHVEDKKDLLLTEDKDKANFHKTKTRNIHLLQDAGGKTAAERMREHLKDKDTDIRDLSENAVRDEGVQGLLKDLQGGTRNGKPVTMWQQVTNGEQGNELKENAAKDSRAPRRSREDKRFMGTGRAAAINSMSDKDLADAMTVGSFRVDTITDTELTGPLGEKIARALASSKANANRVIPVPPPGTPPPPLGTPPPPVVAAAQAAFGTVIANPTSTRQQKEDAHAAMYQVTNNVTASFGLNGAGTAVGATAGEARTAMRKTLERDQTAARDFAAGHLVTNSDVAKVIEETVQLSDIARLMARYTADGTSATEKTNIAASLRNIQTALNNQRANHAVAGAPPGTYKLPNSLADRVKAVDTAVSEL